MEHLAKHVRRFVQAVFVYYLRLEVHGESFLCFFKVTVHPEGMEVWGPRDCKDGGVREAWIEHKSRDTGAKNISEQTGQLFLSECKQGWRV